MSKGRTHVPHPPQPPQMLPQQERPWAGRPHRVPILFVRPMVELLTEDGKGDGLVQAPEFPLNEAQFTDAIWDALKKAGLDPKR